MTSVLLPLLGAAAHSLARWVARPPAGLATAVLVAAAVAALLLHHGVAPAGGQARVRVAAPSPAPAAVAAEVERLLAARDLDRDGALSGEELSARPLPASLAGADVGGDGVVSGEELRAVVTIDRSGAWASSPRGAERLRLDLDLDPAATSSLALVILAALAGSLTFGSGRAADVAAPALLGGAAALAAACLLADLRLAAAAWGAGVLAALLVAQAPSADGSPLRIGAGTLLLIAAGAALVGAGALLAPPGAPAILALGGAALLLAFHAAPAPPAHWASAHALAAGAVAPAAVLLVPPPGAAAEDAPLLTGVVASLFGLTAAFAAARALTAERLDQGVGWVVFGQAAAALALALAFPRASVLGVAVAAGVLGSCALAAGTDALSRRAGTLSLARLGGAGRLLPGGAVALLGGALALITWHGAWIVPRAGDEALRLGGAPLLTVGALALALPLLAAALVRWVARVLGGRGGAFAAGAPAATAALGLVGLVAAGGVSLLTGASRVGDSAAWSLAGVAPEVSLLAASLLLVAAGLALGIALRERPVVPGAGALRLEVTLEPFLPQRRLAQPVLGLGRRIAAREADRAARARGALSRAGAALARGLERVPSPPSAGPSDAAAWRDAGLTAGALALALLLMFLFT